MVCDLCYLSPANCPTPGPGHEEILCLLFESAEQQMSSDVGLQVSNFSCSLLAFKYSKMTCRLLLLLHCDPPVRLLLGPPPRSSGWSCGTSGGWGAAAQWQHGRLPTEPFRSGAGTADRWEDELHSRPTSSELSRIIWTEKRLKTFNVSSFTRTIFPFNG